MWLVAAILVATDAGAAASGSCAALEQQAAEGRYPTSRVRGNRFCFLSLMSREHLGHPGNVPCILPIWLGLLPGLNPQWPHLPS